MTTLRRFLLLIAAVPLLWAASADAATVFLKARLNGAQAGVSTPADGSALLAYDTASRQLTWTVNYRNLSSAFSAAHLHGPADPGADAPVVVAFTNSASPLTGSATITGQQEAELLEGLWYVNVHTNDAPNGEIRGQVSSIETNLYDVHSGWAAAGLPAYTLRGTVTFDPATLQMTWGIAASAPLLHTITGSAFHGPVNPVGFLSGPGFPFQIGAAPVTVANSPTPAATLTPEQAADLVNGLWSFDISSFGEVYRALVAPALPHLEAISTRGLVQSGDNVLIAGFIIDGTRPKTVVVTTGGPSLASAGIANPLPDPRITVVRADGSIVPSTEMFIPQGFAPANPLEDVFVATLPPGIYTAIVEGVAGGTGVGLVAVYEIDQLDVPLVSISTRGRVQGGDNVLIGGFIIHGNALQQVLITGTGPSLAANGVTGILANPAITLVRASDQTVVAANDDWQTATNAAQIQVAGFGLTNPLESAILITLEPGAYTAILSGAGDTTGIGIVAISAVR